ncbi:serine/threonine-protein kinase VRK1-like isoform X2 [Physella acuta]|nr:serine/threonine-protein kinase VRK1-like isoform X2 [Physella acuta]
MQFYQRVAKQASIQSFITANRLRYLGVPPFIATGNLEHKSKEYRFLVMPRFGTDLQKLLLENGDKFSPMVTFAVGLRMIDALHFIHDNEYVHADIKAANILQGYVKGKVIPNEVYLVDYGLASRYTVDGVHREYKEDPKRAHDGTIEFTSRDAHRGAFPSRRGDMEILGFCMLRWLSGKLPWEDNLKNAAYVASSKEKYMADIPNLVKTCLSGSSAADCIQKYLEAVQKMKYESTPSYDSLRKILLNGLEKAGQKNQWEINLQTSKGTKRKSTDFDMSPKAKKSKTPPAVVKKSRRKVIPDEPVEVVSPKKNKKTVEVPKKSPKLTKAKVSPKKSPISKSRTSATQKKKHFPMPPPTKKSPVKTPVKSRTPIKRKRVKKEQTNASVQTTPGLKSNS